MIKRIIEAALIGVAVVATHRYMSSEKRYAENEIENDKNTEEEKENVEE